VHPFLYHKIFISYFSIKTNTAGPSTTTKLQHLCSVGSVSIGF